MKHKKRNTFAGSSVENSWRCAQVKRRTRKIEDATAHKTGHILQRKTRKVNHSSQKRCQVRDQQIRAAEHGYFLESNHVFLSSIEKAAIGLAQLVE